MKRVPLIKKLRLNHDLSTDELRYLLTSLMQENDPHRDGGKEYLFAQARQVRETAYGKEVYIRGLIEFSNYCRNDCYYCGIRKSNRKVERYRLTQDEIMNCVREGYFLGFRTFVLQGGEDMWFTRERLADIIRTIKSEYPDCAVTLSVGERSEEDYRCWKKAGADRYLLRHETAVDKHYCQLHPADMSLRNRKDCLYRLKKSGYQIGAGMMIGTPGQTLEYLIEDIRFLQDLQPHMIGIGPFIPHKDTPFAEKNKGSTELTLIMLSVLRLIFPDVLLPATTALATVSEDGRKRGLMAGANVVMPNLSPVQVRDQYTLYDKKVSTGAEAAQSVELLGKCVREIGYHIVTDRGDSHITY